MRQAFICVWALVLIGAGAGSAALGQAMAPSTKPSADKPPAKELVKLELTLARTAGSAKFVERARALGYSEEQIGSLIARIQAYGSKGQLAYTATGGLAKEDLLLIGRRGIFSTASRARHELAHVLDDIANPGLMSRSVNPSEFGFFGYLRAETVAYRAQLGLCNPAAFWASGLTASASRFGNPGVIVDVTGTSAAGYGTYRYGIRPLLDATGRYLIDRL
jgi:hypothetical protein